MRVELYHVTVKAPFTRTFDVPIYDVPILRAEWENALREKYKDRMGHGGPYVVFHRTGIERHVEFHSEYERIQGQYIGLMGQHRMWEAVYPTEESFRDAFEKAEWVEEDDGVDPEIAEAIALTHAIKEEEVEQARRLATAFLEESRDLVNANREALGKDRLVLYANAVERLRHMTQRIGVTSEGMITPEAVIEELETAKEAIQPIVDFLALVNGTEDGSAEDDDPIDPRDLDDPAAVAACDHIRDEWLDAFVDAGMTINRLAQSSIEEIDAIDVKGLGKVTAMRIQEWAADQVAMSKAAATE